MVKFTEDHRVWDGFVVKGTVQFGNMYLFESLISLFMFSLFLIVFFKFHSLSKKHFVEMNMCVPFAFVKNGTAIS